tara:strand:- start:26756 stop:26872 length:117 start_codon:yes stop_codon:yes gene_type:complete
MEEECYGFYTNECTCASCQSEARFQEEREQEAKYEDDE